MGWEIVRSPKFRMRGTKPVGRTHGIALPAFFHNVQYHFMEVHVYSDGLIDCCGCVDAHMFRRTIEQGRVASPPTGAVARVFNLGAATVGSCHWQRTTAEFLKQVEGTINTLNPSRTGPLDMNGDESEIPFELRYKQPAYGKPYIALAADREIDGDSMPVFVFTGSETYLSHWFVFADGSSRVGCTSTLSSVSEIAKKFDGGDLGTSVPNGTRIRVEGVGTFEAQQGSWGVKPTERVREAWDMLAILKGGRGAVQECMIRFKECQIAPSPETRESLRQAYESVPEHRRCYCGDMNSQDWPIRKLLYGSEQLSDGFGFGRHAPSSDY